jgi:hypothetical protein
LKRFAQHRSRIVTRFKSMSTLCNDTIIKMSLQKRSRVAENRRRFG